MNQKIEDIRAFLALSDRVGTAGQPTEEQFAAVGEDGYEVVINLALPDSPGALEDEAAVVGGLGMEYVRIPVVFTAPQVGDAERFFEAMNVSHDKKVFVHCAANMRVSAFLYLYRVIFEGVAEGEAARDLHRIWTPDEIWQRFMDEVVEQHR